MLKQNDYLYSAYSVIVEQDRLWQILLGTTENSLTTLRMIIRLLKLPGNYLKAGNISVKLAAVIIAFNLPVQST